MDKPLNPPDKTETNPHNKLRDSAAGGQLRFGGLVLFGVGMWAIVTGNTNIYSVVAAVGGACLMAAGGMG